MPKPNRSIDLTVTIRYHGVKATAYFSKFTGESIKVVRGDIAALRMPQPKTTSFELVSHGCVEFGWDLMFPENVIHKSLKQKITPPHLEDKQDLQEQLRELSITKISLRETPSFTGHAKPIVPQKRPSDHEVHMKELGEKPTSTSTSSRITRQSWIKSELAPQTIPTAARPHAPLPTPSMSIASMSQDEDIRPAKRLKTEPKEPVLRFTPSPRPRQSQSSVQLPTSSLTQVQVPSPQSTPPAALNLPSTQEPNELSTNGAGRVLQASSAVQGQERTRPPLQATPSNPSVADDFLLSCVNNAPLTMNSPGPPKPFVPTLNQMQISKRVKDKEIESPSEDQPTAKPPTATIPPNPPQDYVSTNVLDIVSEQEGTSPVPNAQKNRVTTNSGSTNETAPPTEPATERTTALATSTTSSPLASTPLTAITGRPPNSSDLPEIQTLSRELWDIRRKLTAGGARESVILDKLKLLHAAYVPEPMSASSDKALQVLKTRLREVEKDLANERCLRLKAEATLQDIRRECKAPFVVPALLDAFISISNLTTQALQRSKES